MVGVIGLGRVFWEGNVDEDSRDDPDASDRARLGDGELPLINLENNPGAISPMITFSFINFSSIFRDNGGRKEQWRTVSTCV